MKFDFIPQTMFVVGSDGVVQIGTACKNNSCRSHYEGPESNEQECQYHPGVPIFHEGFVSSLSFSMVIHERRTATFFLFHHLIDCVC